LTAVGESMLATISEIGRKYLRMHLASGVGPVRLRKLIEHFGSIDAMLGVSVGELQRVSGVGPKVAEAVFRARDGDAVEHEIARASECGARIVCLADEDYPKPLLHIPDPPTCLYVRGRLEATDGLAIAIVGTRRCSHYAREQALRFGELLAGAGFTIVSGFARGVDGYAHEGALRAGGRTIAVLGNGLSEIYPEEHADLAERVVESGAIVSELPMDVAPDSKNFPGRNRIIAGLSMGVLVVEAGRGSGALITAEAATDYNREVFAIPGAVDRPELTAGSNGLVRDGAAKLVTCLEDILDELKDVGELMTRGAPKEDERGVVREGGDGALLRGLTAQQRAVFDAVAGGAEDVDAACEASGADAASVMTALTSLQIRGLVRQLPGNRFVRR
jgi:DNA processing protein